MPRRRAVSLRPVKTSDVCDFLEFSDQCSDGARATVSRACVSFSCEWREDSFSHVCGGGPSDLSKVPPRGRETQISCERSRARALCAVPIKIHTCAPARRGWTPHNCTCNCDIPNPKMWRPGFVFYSKSYFPSDLPQALRPAGPPGYMICITDFVKDTDETGPSDFNFEIEKPSNFDFNIERCDTHTTFQKFQNRNRPTFDFEEIPKSKSANFPIENCTHFDWGKSERRVGSHPHDFDGLLKPPKCELGRP